MPNTVGRKAMRSLIAFANIMFAFMILGALYSTQDATDESDVYSAGDAFDNYEGIDFGLAFVSVIFAQILSALNQKLTLTQAIKSKMITGLAIALIQIAASVILIPIMVVNYCCEASALWSVGIITITALEVFLAEFVIATISAYSLK